MHKTTTGFLSFDDLADSQGELAISMEYNPVTQKVHIKACAPLPDTLKAADITTAYLTLCNFDSPSFESFFLSNSSTTSASEKKKISMPQHTPTYTILDTRMLQVIFAGKKYKPVALKVQPVKTELPS